MGHSMSGVGVLDKAVVILAACVDGAAWPSSWTAPSSPARRHTGWRRRLEIHRLLVRDQQGRWRPGPRLGELANAAPDVFARRGRTDAHRAARTPPGKSPSSTCAARTNGSASPPPSGPWALRDTVPVGGGAADDRRLGGPGAAGVGARPRRSCRCCPGAKFTGRTLAEVRRRGWAQSVAERKPGWPASSAPIRDRTGRVIAAISVSGPIERLGRRPGDRHAMAVVRAGQRLSGL